MTVFCFSKSSQSLLFNRFYNIDILKMFLIGNLNNNPLYKFSKNISKNSMDTKFNQNSERGRYEQTQ